MRQSVGYCSQEIVSTLDKHCFGELFESGRMSCDVAEWSGGMGISDIRLAGSTPAASSSVSGPSRFGISSCLWYLSFFSYLFLLHRGVSFFGFSDPQASNTAHYFHQKFRRTFSDSRFWYASTLREIWTLFRIGKNGWFLGIQLNSERQSSSAIWKNQFLVI